MDTDNISEQEAQEILRNFAESKANLHTFFTNVIKAKDTIKTGNLTQDELGMPSIPVRTYKELAVFSNDIANQSYWSEYFNKISEVNTSSSLSKEGFLMKLSVTNKRELADVTKRSKTNKGWFQKKNENTME